jgi:HK97 family phage major capsid protein
MTVATSQSRDRIAAARERATRARRQRADIDSSIAEAKGAGDTQTEQALVARRAQVQDEVEMADTLANALLSQLAGVANTFGAETFLENPDTVRELEQLASSSIPIGSLNLGPAISAEGLLAMLDSGSWGPSSRRFAATGDGMPSLPDTARQTQYYGVTPALRRRIRLLDLIPSAPMQGRSFDYTREAGSFDTAFETAEGEVKPPGDLDLQDAQVVAKTIAHWMKLRRQQLADVPALGQVVQTRLSYGVLRRVENQLVAGDGTGENLLGLIHSGIPVVDYLADVPLADLALSGIVDVLAANASPDAVVLNPADYGQMLAAKATGSGERLDSNGAFSTPGDTIWGLPAIVSTVLPAGQALVGDFGLGATLFVREGVNVRASDSDQDDFVRNRVTLLGEGRFGLAIWQLAAFALVNFSSTGGASGASGPSGASGASGAS